jgi:exonuclease III
MRLLTWNLAWAPSSSDRGREIVRRIRTANPDIAIFTEVTTSLVETLGSNAIYSSPDYGYDSEPERRKVALWSSAPFAKFDQVGSTGLPTGRFVAADVAGIRVVGVCIPWRDAHVRSGRRDRMPWQDHLTYIEGLSTLASNYRSSTVIAGDFNQRCPRHGQPPHVYQALREALGHMRWLTEGPIEPLGRASIDHVVATTDITAIGVHGVSNEYGESRLSDHFGVSCELAT